MARRLGWWTLLLWRIANAADTLRDLLVWSGIWGPVVALLSALAVLIGAILERHSWPVVVTLTLAVFVLLLWFFIGIRLLRERRVFRGGSIRETAPQPIQPKPWATEEELRQTYISERSLRIVDLVPREGKPIIDGKVFENCHIYGPAVVLPLDAGNQIVNSTWVGSDTPDSLFIEISPERFQHAFAGVVGIRGVIIRGCRLLGIGLIGTAEHVVNMRKGIQPKED